MSNKLGRTRQRKISQEAKVKRIRLGGSKTLGVLKRENDDSNSQRGKIGE